MHSIPFALSLSKYVNSAGAYVGFASILAVALLVILYFAHARETSTLRERLREAHDRIDALESRIAQLIQLQAVRGQQPPQQATQHPRVVPAPASVGTRPMGSAVASLRRVADPVSSSSDDDGERPAAPAGVGAPALASATSTIPGLASATPPVRIVAPAAANVGEDTMLVPPGSGAAGNGSGFEQGDTAIAAVAAVSEGGPAPAAAATAVGRGGGRRGAPPRVQIRAGAPGGTNRRPAPPARGSLLEDPPRRQWGRRLLPVIGVIVGVAFIVVVLLKVTANNNPTANTAVAQTSKQTKAKSGTASFNASNVVVAVLNGTSVSGLAKDVSDTLAKQGYRAGSITNAAVQTQKTTVVYYIRNEKTAAQHVAKALGVKPKSVLPATQSVIQSCSTTPADSSNSCQGDVIVSVGADHASLASNTASA